MSAFQQAVEQIATATAQPEHYVRQSLLSVMTAEEWDALSARIGELEAENDKLWADLTFCMNERNEARRIAAYLGFTCGAFNEESPLREKVESWDMEAPESWREGVSSDDDNTPASPNGDRLQEIVDRHHRGLDTCAACIYDREIDG